jgi:hypothetical protein
MPAKEESLHRERGESAAPADAAAVDTVVAAERAATDGGSGAGEEGREKELKHAPFPGRLDDTAAAAMRTASTNAAM